MSAIAFVGGFFFLIGGVLAAARGDYADGAVAVLAGAVLIDFCWRREAR